MFITERKIKITIKIVVCIMCNSLSSKISADNDFLNKIESFITFLNKINKIIDELVYLEDSIAQFYDLTNCFINLQSRVIVLFIAQYIRLQTTF
jgi:hypothetical protein